MPSAELTVRDARADDAAAIAVIYNQGIADRIATLETEERTAEERTKWLAARSLRHPVLVAERDGMVVGWGSLNQFNPRKAYDHVVDFSVYVERDWRGKRVGSSLLRALIARAQQLGYHKMVLSAFPWNKLGMALYEKHGFRTVGIYKEQGLLDGKWVGTPPEGIKVSFGGGTHGKQRVSQNETRRKGRAGATGTGRLTII